MPAIRQARNTSASVNALQTKVAGDTRLGDERRDVAGSGAAALVRMT
jgi:hypothetical protein